MRVLIVEDNSSFAALTAQFLLKAGIDSDVTVSAQEAEQAVARLDYAAIILDLGLPDQDGLEFLRGLRARGNSVPVLITSARYGLNDRVTGLNQGADDYLAKPFTLDELLARLQAVMRRPPKLMMQILRAGNVGFNPRDGQMRVGTRSRVLRRRESLMFEILVRHLGQVVKRTFLDHQLYGMEGEPGLRAVEVYMYRVRRHLEELGASLKIHTIRGVGYMLIEEVETAAAARSVDGACDEAQPKA
jgi:DNA-binding response OmpR family regulator